MLSESTKLHTRMIHKNSTYFLSKKYLTSVINAMYLFKKYINIIKCIHTKYQ